MSQSLKSPSAAEVQGGAGIPGCLEIATGFPILHISFSIKSSKIPQFLCLHVKICRTSSFVCFHQELLWKESKERFCREVPKREALKQLKPNQTKHSGLVLWELLLGIQCPPQGHPKLLAGSVPSPHARSSQAVPPNPCVHAGAGISTQGPQFHGLSVPAGTP